jgi:hypothetical protein
LVILLLVFVWLALKCRHTGRKVYALHSDVLEVIQIPNAKKILAEQWLCCQSGGQILIREDKSVFTEIFPYGNDLET